MKNTSRYFGTGRRRGFEESLISDDDERSGADEAGHAMRLPSAASSSSSSSSVPPQGYGSAAASDFSEYSAYEGESELLSDREITRKLRVGGRHSGSQEENENRIDVKIWAVRSLAVILAVSMIFVVSMQQSNLTSSESITSNGVNSEAEPKVSDLMASNLPPNVVFILADDLGYHSLNVDVSPFLMQLRGNGVILSKYYSQEVCTPARAALLTGRYPISVGWQKNEASVIETGGLGLSETTLAEVLKSKGYTTFMFGKWNLGNSSPRYLPTARGFDYFLGYLDGFSNYWSKTDPTYPDYHDLMYSDGQCYFQYDWDDMNQYSSFLYRDKAIEAIEMHNFSASPMFMYLAFQAVHDPFGDSDDRYGKGIPKEYMDSSRYAYISNMVEGNINQEYNKALALMDASIESIYAALDDRGVLDNTYIIFASDNGGCPASGGKNTPLRGSKGSLFEGGVHVDAFIYGNTLLDHTIAGSKYDGLFHVSDWFPTILSMIGSPDFTPIGGYELDGVSQWDDIIKPVPPGTLSTDIEYPRKYLLVNYYYNPGKQESDSNSFWLSSPGAIRDSRWKLMHTYESSTAGTWFSESEMSYNGDDNLQEKGGCTQAASWEDGEFTYFLFDLEKDPYETTNLYDSSLEAKQKQLELYLQMDSLTSKAVDINNNRKVSTCYAAWESSSNYIVPWDEPEEYASLMIPDSSIRAVHGAKAYPDNCGMYSQAFISARITPYHSAVVPEQPHDVVLPSSDLPFDGPGSVLDNPSEVIAGPIAPVETIPLPVMTATSDGAAATEPAVVMTSSLPSWAIGTLLAAGSSSVSSPASNTATTATATTTTTTTASATSTTAAAGSVSSNDNATPAATVPVTVTTVPVTVTPVPVTVTPVPVTPAVLPSDVKAVLDELVSELTSTTSASASASASTSGGSSGVSTSGDSSNSQKAVDTAESSSTSSSGTAGGSSGAVASSEVLAEVKEDVQVTDVPLVSTTVADVDPSSTASSSSSSSSPAVTTETTEAVSPSPDAATEPSLSETTTTSTATTQDEAVSDTLTLFGFAANTHAEAVEQAFAAIINTPEPTGPPTPSGKPSLPPTSKPVWSSKVSWGR